MIFDQTIAREKNNQKVQHIKHTHSTVYMLSSSHYTCVYIYFAHVHYVGQSSIRSMENTQPIEHTFLGLTLLPADYLATGGSTVIMATTINSYSKLRIQNLKLHAVIHNYHAVRVEAEKKQLRKNVKCGKFSKEKLMDNS